MIVTVAKSSREAYDYVTPVPLQSSHFTIFEPNDLTTDSYIKQVLVDSYIYMWYNYQKRQH